MKLALTAVRKTTATQIWRVRTSVSHSGDVALDMPFDTQLEMTRVQLGVPGAMQGVGLCSRRTLGMVSI